MTERAQLGMAMFLIAEAVFFFLLILAFAYFRAMPQRSRPWDGSSQLRSSRAAVSMWRAMPNSLWLWITIALGAAFLGRAVIFLGTTFFTLAGFTGCIFSPG